MPKVIIVMPAYNAAATLEKTVADIPDGTADEIILVDDASTDGTVDIARDMRLTVYEHATNKGYGANQKTCYTEALKREPDLVIMIHPDYQYDSALAPNFIDLIGQGHFDIVLGTRIHTRSRALQSGMPFYKYVANRALTFIENLAMGQNLSEYHTGYRAYSAKVLRTIPWAGNSDDFVFDSQMLIQAIHHGFSIAEIPVPTRYSAESSSIGFAKSVDYGIRTLMEVGKFLLAKWGICKSGGFR